MNVAIAPVLSDVARLIREWEKESLLKGEDIQKILITQSALWQQVIMLLEILEDQNLLDKKGKTLLRTLRRVRGQNGV